MRPLRISKPGTTKFQKMAAGAKRAQAFRDLVKAKGKPKPGGSRT